jgi:hypothetical protein
MRLPVSVRVSQMLAKTKFTAFGDSITEGVVSLAPFIMLGPPDTYPLKLEQMLLQRYLLSRSLSSMKAKRAKIHGNWLGAFRRFSTLITRKCSCCRGHQRYQRLAHEHRSRHSGR